MGNANTSTSNSSSSSSTEVGGGEDQNGNMMSSKMDGASSSGGTSMSMSCIKRSQSIRKKQQQELQQQQQQLRYNNSLNSNSSSPFKSTRRINNNNNNINTNNINNHNVDNNSFSSSSTPINKSESSSFRDMDQTPPPNTVVNKRQLPKVQPHPLHTETPPRNTRSTNVKLESRDTSPSTTTGTAATTSTNVHHHHDNGNDRTNGSPSTPDHDHDHGRGPRQVVDVMCASPLRWTKSSSFQLRNSPNAGVKSKTKKKDRRSLRKQCHDDDGDGGVTRRREGDDRSKNQNQNTAIVKSNSSKERWQSAWEEDSETSSSDEEVEEGAVRCSRDGRVSSPQHAKTKIDIHNHNDDDDDHDDKSRHSRIRVITATTTNTDTTTTTTATTVSDEDFQENNDSTGPNPSMFSPLRVLGKGSFGKVVLVQRQRRKQGRNDNINIDSDKDNGGGLLYAMKILRKTHLLRRGQIERTKTERKVLSLVDHPFIMKLHFAFQTDDKLFLVLDYCAGGELFFHLSRHRKFPERVTRFYAAELLLALGHCHSKGIVYRDLKPENIVLDAGGHVKLGDFGLAKDDVRHPYQGANSRVGTPEYMAPEILQQSGHGFCVDYWGLGMLVYEMLTGLPPWYTTDRTKLFRRINSAPLEVPSYFSSEARSFVHLLLKRDPRRRLGVRGLRSVAAHDFFYGVDFQGLLERTIQAPILPCEGVKIANLFEDGNNNNRNSSRESSRPVGVGIDSKKNLSASDNGHIVIKNQNDDKNNNKESFKPIKTIQQAELDAATANFEKQFTRMPVNSLSERDECLDHNYDDDDLSSDEEELNDSTFAGFTFDDDDDDNDRYKNRRKSSSINNSYSTL